VPAERIATFDNDARAEQPLYFSSCSPRPREGDGAAASRVADEGRLRRS
jgi:hypothetical protein